jgi:hypothetical protein
MQNWGVNCAHGTLAKYAVIGGGPVFRRIGRVPLYSTDDLDAWVQSRLSGPMRSTSDVAKLKLKLDEGCQRANPGAAVKQEASDSIEQPAVHQQEAAR